MVELQVDLPDVRVAWDLARDRWTIERGDRAWTARRWTWGERARLLAWSTDRRGLDADRFVRGLVDLLVSPPDAEGDDLAALASALLELHGVVPGAASGPLSAAALTAARALGWGPRELEGQPIPEVDRLLASIEAPAAPQPAAPDDGWTRIVVQDD